MTCWMKGLDGKETIIDARNFFTAAFTLAEDLDSGDNLIMSVRSKKDSLTNIFLHL